MIEFSYQPEWVWLFVAAVAAGALVFWSYKTAFGRPKTAVKALLIVLRLLIIAGVALCLLNPQRVTRIEHRPPARLAVLLDTSRSMSLRDLGVDRLSHAKAWLRERLVPNIPPNVALSWFSYDRQLRPLSGAGNVQTPPIDAASPTGGVTAIAGNLDRLLTTHAAEPLMGVLLCSDGIETTPQDPVAMAKLYRRKGIPIHTVAFGTTNEPRDIVIENIQVKRAVASQSKSRILVTVRSAGFQGVSIPVQLRFNNQVIAQTPVTLSGGAQSVELEFSPRLKGYHVFEAVVPLQRDEWLAANNRRPFGLEVVDPTIRVIYMEGTPKQARQPEWMYLKDALESDPNIEVKALYRPPSGSAQHINTVESDPETGDRVYHVQHPTQGYPRTLAGLLTYDVVILSDIAKEAFSAEQLLATAKLVEEHGGGFVMVGGKKAFGAGGYHRTIMDKFIPVAMENDSDTTQHTLQLTVLPQAYAHPLIAIGATARESVEIWTEKFPSLMGYNRVGRAKPGAMALAVDESERNEFGPRIIVAAQEVGKGRTMAFTSDITRSWGAEFETVWGEKIDPSRPLNEMNCDSRYYRHFWINAIRWLAAGKVASSNNPVTLELARTVCRPGDTVPATVRVLGRDMQSTGDAEVFVSLSAPGKTDRLFPAKYDAATRLYQASVTTPSVGDHTVTATASLRKTKLGEDKQLLVCEDTDLEMEKVRVNSELMAGIARTSGGVGIDFLKPDTAWVKNVFGNAPPATVEIRRLPLWDRAFWLSALILLLASEWVLRRLNGLA